MQAEVIIVGAGLAGLTCALKLKKAGHHVRLLEKASAVGGRVQTDTVDGFQLDRGFQVMLTAYPNCQALLDYPALRLGTFEPGALLYHSPGVTSRVSDPFRRPTETFATLRAPIGSLRDKVLILKLRALLRRGVPFRTAAWTSRSTEVWLRDFGFSEQIIENFFRPFFSGIFLEKDLATSAWMLAYTYSYFTRGYAALPAGGMGSISQQLAAAVGEAQIECGVTVEQVSENAVTTADGRRYTADAVVVAVDGDSARKWFPDLPRRAWNAAGCFYFDAEASPLGRDRRVWLNASGTGEVNQIAVPSDIAAGYAPAGRTLVSVGTLGTGSFDAAAVDRIRDELVGYFGERVKAWRFLKAYAIPRALPQSTPGALHGLSAYPDSVEGVYLCGDYQSVGAIDAAMQRGLDTAQRLLESNACVPHT